MSSPRPVPAQWNANPGPGITLSVLVLLSVACFLSIGRDLWTPDEPREAEISREMWLSPGVVPTVNGRPFVEKPPLYYWTVASLFAAAGDASAPVARSVSAVSSFLVLLLVYLWGRREFSGATGLIAAVGLASSAQFMISSHWVLIDPLLMLFMTVVCWSGWEMIRDPGRWRPAFAFYLALVLALWTKGLIAPVLMACGILAYVVWKRSLRPVWLLRPILGVLVLVAATALFGYLVYREAGFEAVREWFWVNHVLRFVAPEDTGHEGPVYYYLYTIPIALTPWWLPLVDAFRRRRWRDADLPNREFCVYLAAICLGMTLILSASTTKRGIYLLPMLPPLALLLAAQFTDWLQRRGPAAVRCWPWWVQLGCVGGFAVVPPTLAMAYLERPDPLAIGYLCVAAALVAAVIACSLRQRRTQAVLALGATALAAVFGLFVVVVRLAAPEKNMSEYIEWVGRQIPADQVVYVFGHTDETLDGIFPFVTGRQTVALTAEEIEATAPAYVVVQAMDSGAKPPRWSPAYERLGDRTIGDSRNVSVWRRLSSGTAPP